MAQGLALLASLQLHFMHQAKYMRDSIINDSGITFGRMQWFHMIILVTFHIERYWLTAWDVWTLWWLCNYYNELCVVVGNIEMIETLCEKYMIIIG